MTRLTPFFTNPSLPVRRGLAVFVACGLLCFCASVSFAQDTNASPKTGVENTKNVESVQGPEDPLFMTTEGLEATPGFLPPLDPGAPESEDSQQTEQPDQPNTKTSTTGTDSGQTPETPLRPQFQPGGKRQSASTQKGKTTPGELPSLPPLDPSMDIGDVSTLEETMKADENAPVETEDAEGDEESGVSQPQEVVPEEGDVRPYEIVQAQRFVDVAPPLFLMDKTTGWQTRTRQGAFAKCELSAEQRVFSPLSLKVTYRALPPDVRQWRTPAIQVSLDIPIPVRQLPTQILPEGVSVEDSAGTEGKKANEPVMEGLRDVMKNAMEDAKSDIPTENATESKPSTPSTPTTAIKTGAPKNPDTISCWIYGDRKGLAPYEEGPEVYAVFKAANDEILEVFLASVSWSEWSMAYAPLSVHEQSFLAAPGVKFFGFRIKNATNTKERSLYFDSLCLFRENRVERLQTSRRPRRGISLADGRSIGQNSGEGRLGFPVFDRTITPSLSNTQALNKLMRSDTGVFALTYDGIDGLLSFFYTPQTGTWSDFKARWNNGTLFSPLEGGGVRTLIDNAGKEVPVARVQHIRTEISRDNKAIITQWRLSTLPSSESPAVTAVVQYRFRMLGKSLMIDTTCRGGRVANVNFGALRNDNFKFLQLFTLPYLTYSNHEDSRPGIVMMNDLFISGISDWYVSNASQFYGRHSISSSLIYYSGGSRYLPKTDGSRNDCYDRFFVTVGPKLQDVLPNVSNPASIWQNTMADGLWWHSNPTLGRNREKNMLRNLWRYGLLRLNVIEGRESWRDSNESFSFRTLPAPKKGGDKALIRQTRFLQEKLKYRFVSYCNFMDISPVNEQWALDCLSRSSTGDLQETVKGNYAFKPAFAIDKHERITRMNHLKYRTSAGFCDGVTSFAPWERTDYDSRIAGGGTFTAIFYLYGEMLQAQKKTWEGPVISSGGCHWLYGGLCDGSMAVDSMYNWQTQPWILDFDLQKLHSLESDIGMGTIEQFYAGSESSLKLLSEKFLDPRLEVSATDAGNAQENATPTTDGGNPADSEKGKSQTEAVPGASENAPSSSQDGNGESGTPGSSQENTPGGAPGNSQENAPVSTPENTGMDVPAEVAPVIGANADTVPTSGSSTGTVGMPTTATGAAGTATVPTSGPTTTAPMTGPTATAPAATPATSAESNASAGTPANSAAPEGKADSSEDEALEASKRIYHPANPIYPNVTEAKPILNTAWQNEQLKDALCDRYVAATMAFGHVGYLLLDYGLERAWRSYFLLQQLQRHYVPTKLFEVAYFDDDGHQVDASTALQEGLVERNHLLVRYHNGTTIFVNGSETETMRTTFGRQYIELPPGGFWGMTGDNQVESFSGNVYNGVRLSHRADYAASPSYLFVDGRGSFVYFPKACGNGPGLCRRLNANTYEIITLNGAECGFDIPAVKATAYDFQGRAMGPAKIRLSRNYVFVEPVEGAFSYILRAEIQALDMPTHVLTCEQEYGKPGERIKVHGKYEYTVEIPQDAKPGERFWYNIDDDWIEFTVESLCDVVPQVHGSKMEVTLVPHVPLEKRALTMTLENGGLEPQTQRVYRLENGMAKMQFDLRRLRSIGLVTLDYRVTIGDLEQKGQIMLNISTPNKVYPLDIIEKGLARETEHAKTAVSMNRIQVKLADGSLSPYFLMVNRKALVKRAMISCGKVEKLGVFVTPMQQHSEGGFAIEDTIHVPDDKIDVVLRADVGKWDGCVSGSSAAYRVELVAANGRRVTLAEQEQLQYGWSHLEADLSPWRGQDVTLRLITNVKGPTDVQDSARSNVGCWANVRLESKKKVYIRKVLSSTP